MLGYSEVKNAASGSRGIKDTALYFEMVTAEVGVDMPKGLYIPSSGKDLFEAIHHGAVASFWRKDEKIPAWLPNHFPLFMTDNIIEAVLGILDHYYYNTKQEEWGKMTIFIFRDEEMGKLQTITNQNQYLKYRKSAEISLKLKGGE
ncbi:hypothetical protein D3H55_05255 [Bacillus salacetis]|uniref:Uncharacterized protein n=1 Tax=Bacillus salacetis TaxID=2315464 RepID=A0A3A1R311_9BACI|nr:hypothetical protein [Bacillus salacetis]RIW36318.1 hypothetical protein D3H55_05255 [Bacillus salacetis]